MAWHRCMAAQHPWHVKGEVCHWTRSCADEFVAHRSLLMWFKSACLHGCLLTSLLKRAATKHRVSLHPALLKQAESLPAAGNWIHTSGLDLDTDVPPPPKHFTGVWWVQMNGAGGGTHRRALCFSTNTYVSPPAPLCSNLFMSAESFCSLPLHYPTALMYLQPCFEVFLSQFQSSSTVAPVPLLTPWLVFLSFLTVLGHQPQVSVQ